MFHNAMVLILKGAFHNLSFETLFLFITLHGKDVLEKGPSNRSATHISKWVYILISNGCALCLYKGLGPNF